MSDIHYACPAERDRVGHETSIVANPLARLMIRAFRYSIWLRHPFEQNHLLDFFLEDSSRLKPSWVVAIGDYSCDTRFIGVSDPASQESARIALDKLRTRYGDRFRAVLGDHELGKTSLAGGQGGPRLASYTAACRQLHLEPFWELRIGRYKLLGVTSTLAAWDVFEPESLPEERAEWRVLHQQHLERISDAFGELTAEDRVILFCHDPTALPFLWRIRSVQERISQLDMTVIGHLHTGLVFWKSRILTGMPAISFLGTAVRRMSTALSEARHWKAFRPRLCHSLAGSELLKDGAYGSLLLDPDGQTPPEFRLHRVPRSGSLPPDSA